MAKRPVKFHVYISNKDFMNARIDDLDLSKRAFNSLKRAKIDTIGQLVDKITCEEDIKKLGRNIGDVSADEIMQAIYEFHLSCLSKEKLKEYLAEVACRQDDPDYYYGAIF